MHKVYEFANGLKLLYAKNDINKSTALEINFKCGAVSDGKLAGLAHFCEHMFFTGNAKENKAEITKQYFDFFKVNAFTNYKEIAFTGQIFTADLKNYLNLVLKMINKSSFTKQAVEEEKKVVCQEIAKDNDKFDRKASRMFNYLKYEEDCYKYGILGNCDTVNQITPAEVKKFVKKYFVASNCVFYICSPLSFSKVKKMVEKFASQLKQGRAPKVKDLAITPIIAQNKGAIYNKELDKNYLSLSFSADIKKPILREALTLDMLCYIINDVSDGINKEIRLKNNLVYYCDVYSSSTKVNQIINICTECSTENINACVDVVANYLKNLLKEGISKKAIDKEKRRLRYCFETKINRPIDYFDDLSNVFWYDKVVTPLEEYKIFQSITKEELDNMLKRFFVKPCFKAMVYGNAKAKEFYTLKALEKKFNEIVEG